MGHSFNNTHRSEPKSQCGIRQLLGNTWEDFPGVTVQVEDSKWSTCEGGAVDEEKAVFSENLPYTSLHLQRVGNERIIMSIESLSQMFQEWRNFIFGWLASKGRKTEKGNVRV
ncbi:hypothetical protein AAES_113578 [Amazona aestiva]|uniref:Uncharacterized protein n=1 Tax=Amazona aestiva TaxID=12930 RepID=A0A0Q3M7U3_AMAAE|nr:hypothetical protein AAES_113578 [Amazona aestiva]